MATTSARPAQTSSSNGLLFVTAGIIAGVLFVSPLIWAALRSFQDPAAITAAPTSHSISHLTLDNYRGLLSGPGNLVRNIANSLLVSILTAVITAAVSTLAGYGFARFPFRGRGVVFALLLATLMIPFQAILTPLFLEMHAFHLTNRLLGLVVFYTTFNLPFGVFVMRNSFQQLPTELEDSARVDGASVMTALTQVYLPLVVPGIATAVMYAFLFSWTEFLGAFTLLTSDDLYTLPVALLGVELGTYGQVNYGFLVAGAVIAMIPCVVLYVGLQRYYVKGLTSGAVKG